MQVIHVAVRFSRTINLGNYESARLEAESEATLEEFEDPLDVQRQLATRLRAEVEGELGAMFNRTVH